MMDLFDILARIIGWFTIFGLSVLGSGWIFWKGIIYWTGFAKVWEETKGKRGEYRKFLRFRKDEAAYRKQWVNFLNNIQESE